MCRTREPQACRIETHEFRTALRAVRFQPLACCDCPVRFGCGEENRPCQSDMGQPFANWPWQPLRPKSDPRNVWSGATRPWSAERPHRRFGTAPRVMSARRVQPLGAENAYAGIGRADQQRLHAGERQQAAGHQDSNNSANLQSEPYMGRRIRIYG